MICAITPSAAKMTRRIPIFLRSAGSSGRGGGCHPKPSRFMDVSSTVPPHRRDSSQHSGVNSSLSLRGFVVKILRKRLRRPKQFQQGFPNDSVRR
jgi:hypothetical protein